MHIYRKQPWPHSALNDDAETASAAGTKGSLNESSVDPKKQKRQPLLLTTKEGFVHWFYFPFVFNFNGWFDPGGVLMVSILFQGLTVQFNCSHKNKAIKQKQQLDVSKTHPHPSFYTRTRSYFFLFFFCFFCFFCFFFKRSSYFVYLVCSVALC